MNRARVEYEDTGADGPVLVFLHGVAMDWSAWQPVVADLTDPERTRSTQCHTSRIDLIRG